MELKLQISESKKKIVSSGTQNSDDENAEKAKEEDKDLLPTNQSYEGIRVVGNGAFSVVYLVKIIETGEYCAIKKVYQNKKYNNREIELMRELYHQNVISLKQAFYNKGDKGKGIYLNLVMDYVPETINRIIKHYNSLDKKMPIFLIKLYSYQLLRALAYVHSLGICHRDIKPSNILIDPQTHELKLCDFGSAKRLKKGTPNVSYICSRYYRAPELIFGATNYTQAIDVWSVGCVICEMIIGQPMFQGDSGVDQLVKIINVLGTPNRDQIKAMNPNRDDLQLPMKKQSITFFKDKKDQSRAQDSNVLDLLDVLLGYNPNTRQKPLEALNNPFFEELRQKETTLPNGQSLPELFNFSEEEIGSTNADLIKALKPSWYKDMEEEKENEQKRIDTKIEQEKQQERKKDNVDTDRI